MHYIVGLGNPGEKYVDTRHNVGRIILEELAKANEFSEWKKSKGANALYAHGNIEESPVELLLPLTYMNNSGQSVLYLQRKHNVQSNNIIVVHDDIDLPVGEIKVSFGKGSGGHKGIDSIIKALGTKDFARIRVGIAARSFWTGKIKRPQGGMEMTKHVLSKFSKREMKTLEEIMERAVGALHIILKDGIEKAMNEFN